jgi:hypothetical protein
MFEGSIEMLKRFVMTNQLVEHNLDLVEGGVRHRPSTRSPASR